METNHLFLMSLKMSGGQICSLTSEKVVDAISFAIFPFNSCSITRLFMLKAICSFYR